MVAHSASPVSPALTLGCSAERPHGLPAFDRAWALFLDFDGTLTQIAPTPGEVSLEPAVKTAVVNKSRLLSGALAIISGRTIGSLDVFFAPYRLPCAGMHGAEIRLADGDRIVPFSAASSSTLAAIASVGTELKNAISDYPGIVLEEKPLALSLHYRAAPQYADICLALACFSTRGFQHLEVRHGKMVIEIVDRRVNKGRALECFMRQPVFQGRVPVFIGDDDADEAAIALAQSMGGIGIRIIEPNPATPTCA